MSLKAIHDAKLIRQRIKVDPFYKAVFRFLGTNWTKNKILCSKEGVTTFDLKMAWTEVDSEDNVVGFNAHSEERKKIKSNLLMSDLMEHTAFLVYEPFQELDIDSNIMNVIAKHYGITNLKLVQRYKMGQIRECSTYATQRKVDSAKKEGKEVWQHRLVFSIGS